jgi:DNA-binding CsgD family transcriptional regulator
MTTLQVNNNGLLTPRETQTLELVAWGKDNEEIAICLGIGRRTAKDYVEHTMHKLHVHKRAHLVTEAFRLGILKFLCVALMLLGTGITIMQRDADIRSQRGRIRAVRVIRVRGRIRAVRVIRVRGRQRDFTQPLHDLIATV